MLLLLGWAVSFLFVVTVDVVSAAATHGTQTLTAKAHSRTCNSGKLSLSPGLSLLQQKSGLSHVTKVSMPVSLPYDAQQVHPNSSLDKPPQSAGTTSMHANGRRTFINHAPFITISFSDTAFGMDATLNISELIRHIRTDGLIPREGRTPRPDGGKGLDLFKSIPPLEWLILASTGVSNSLLDMLFLHQLPSTFAVPCAVLVVWIFVAMAYGIALRLRSNEQAALQQKVTEVEDLCKPFPITVIKVRDCAAALVALDSPVRGNEEKNDVSESKNSTDCTSNASASVPDAIHQVRRPSGHQIVTSFSEGEAFQHLLEVHVPGLTLTTVKKDIFSDEWNRGSLIFDHYEGLGAWNIAVGPWIDDSTEACGGTDCGDGPRLRELSMELPVPKAPMCPKSTRMTATMCVLVSRSSDTPSLTLLCTTVSHDVPFGDKFVVQEKIELLPLESGEGVRFCKHGRVVFLKRCGILNSLISSSSTAELTRTGEKLVALLKQCAAPSLDQSVPSGKVTFVVHIWELQRRVTVWSKSWKPPFLPHDGRKRWRWVDPAYQVHAWMSAESREAAAASTIPPIEPWQGYKMLKPWQVSCTSSGAHDDGWQYAIDFYQQDKFWRGAASGCHVRRRLWTCTFVEA